MKRRVLLLLLALALLTAPRAGAASSGSFGDAVKWELSEDGVLTVSGSGPMNERSRLGDNTAQLVKSLVIEEGVTRIEKKAFAGFPNLETVTMSDTVESIGSAAFSECGKLRSVRLSESIRCISDNCFYKCPQLSEIVLPSGLLEIYEGAFEQCSSLEHIIIPYGTVMIGYRSFCKSGIKSIVIPETVTFLGDFAFSDCLELREIRFMGEKPDGTKTYNNWNNTYTNVIARFCCPVDSDPSDPNSWKSFENNAADSEKRIKYGELDFHSFVVGNITAELDAEPDSEDAFDSIDLLLAGKYVASGVRPDPDGLGCCDIDCDGELTIIDLLMLAKKCDIPPRRFCGVF